ncbi:MAG: CGGC domain-containing protein [Candidatus Heimdallarchaeota archaeon]|nr:CGGC domain-containing protein [Candidatus Heimdallarchaeota archaeon]
MLKIGIIICDRYKQCDGGKCFRAIENREGAFKRYSLNDKLAVVSYATCGGCPGGNVENVVTGMKIYGAQAIHFGTGFLAGYPPCIYVEVLKKFAEEKTGLPVIVGTHPMPTNYIEMHGKLDDWSNLHKKMLEEYELLLPEETIKYDSTLPIYIQDLEVEIGKR